MTELFPMIQPKLYPQQKELPLFRDAAWDYRTNTPIWREGSPVMAEGSDAVAVWAYNALQTPRYRHEIYTWDYGNELDSLVGSGYTEEVKQAEAVRYVRECLLTNPYIREVSDINVSFADSRMTITCKLITVYGEVSLKI